MKKYLSFCEDRTLIGLTLGAEIMVLLIGAYIALFPWVLFSSIVFELWVVLLILYPLCVVGCLPLYICASHIRMYARECCGFDHPVFTVLSTLLYIVDTIVTILCGFMTIIGAFVLLISLF